MAECHTEIVFPVATNSRGEVFWMTQGELFDYERWSILVGSSGAVPTPSSVERLQEFVKEDTQFLAGLGQ